MSASGLSEACDVSLATVYRRLETLVERGLLSESVELDADGNHRSVYEADLERVDVRLVDGEFEVSVTRREDAVDRFARMWNDMRKEDG